MGDRLSTEERRHIMSRVRSKNTRPERTVRSLAHNLGLRFRLHRSNLPGKPDLVFPRWRTIILVHGCFWHQHIGCKKCTLPHTNADFWSAKLSRNVERDAQTKAELERLGWSVAVIWECETRMPGHLLSRLKEIFPSIGVHRLV